MTKPATISFAFIPLILFLVGWLGLATLFLTGLFSYFALNQLRFGYSKALGVTLFVILTSSLGFGFFFFSKQAYVAIPKIVSTTIPVMIEYAEKQGVELPFYDYDSLKQLAMDTVKEKMSGVGRYARDASLQIASLLIGFVVAISLFVDPRFDLRQRHHSEGEDLYSSTWNEISIRFQRFYESFSTVIGAQIVISTINTALTAAFLLWSGFPHASVIIVLTFLFGLLPIIGNLMSNTLIVGVGLTISPQMAFISLAYLVVLHKLEYFLNSKIIGDRIKNPMWLTLLGLIIGEKLMGIPGMILAPVVLHYVKVEATRSKMPNVKPSADKPEETAPAPKPQA
ncbi:MAG TPA: AI-2E family transporter [Roseimicrobium sp.]|nr:AI-2E family transporter [Roseimicrobium sp.]